MLTITHSVTQALSENITSRASCDAKNTDTNTNAEINTNTNTNMNTNTIENANKDIT